MAKRPILAAVEQLEASGLKRCGTFLGSHVLCAVGDDKNQYIRFFSPQFISKDDGKALVGLLGTMRSEVMADWGKFQRLSDYFVLSAFSANFPNLRDPPIFNVNGERDQEWCERIVHTLKSFPTNRDELEHLINECAKIHGFDVKRMDIRI